MAVGFRILDTEDAGWDPTVLRAVHDIYHLRGYARVCETHESDPLRLAVAERDGEVLVVPVIVRPLPEHLPGCPGECDITVPYGYPVPIASTDDARAVRALVEVLWEGLREIGAVTAFLRCHPLLGVPREALEPEAHLVSHGEHVVVNLDLLGDDPVPSFRENHRRNVRGLIRDGFTLRYDEDGDWAEFPALYRETMQRADADAYYLFPEAYFRALRKELGEQVSLVSAVSPDGELAAACILFVCGSAAQYHLSCTVASYLAKAPVKLAFVGMMNQARERGATRLNLGSGLGGACDSLFAFKAGFSDGRAAFESVRVVLDARRYETLSAGKPAPDGFFPAYRYRG